MSPRIRVFLNIPIKNGEMFDKEVRIDDDNAHHLRNVLRVTPGTVLVAISKDTRDEFEAIVTEISKSWITIKILQRLNSPKVINPVASVMTALLKGSKNDLVCEKGTELGVGNIIFWGAERSTVKVSDDSQLNSKQKRWATIAESASRQSGRLDVPHVRIFSSLELLLTGIRDIIKPNDRLLALSLSENAKELKDLNPLTTQSHLLIGPEGDLTEKEERKLIEHGFELVHLGPYILRSETAAIAGISMVQALSRVR